MRLWELGMDGKVAIVTGGGRGIGRAISLGLARCGASVCIADVDAAAGDEVAAEISALGPGSLSLQVDATDNAQVVKMADQTIAAFGRVDILINNAGGASGPTFRIGRMLNITERDWDDTFTRNLKGLFHCTRAVVPAMLARRKGSIVNMASLTGRFPFPGLPAYSAAKAAVINLTKSMAMEFAPHVRVNALAPGLIETPRTSLNRRPEQLEGLLTNVPLGRMGTPEEVADMAVYLASDVSDYITGTVMDCAGGQVWMTEDGRPNWRDAVSAPKKPAA